MFFTRGLYNGVKHSYSFIVPSCPAEKAGTLGTTGIKDRQMFDNCVHYIHMNPVAAGFVMYEEHWPYSSASGYAENNGLLKLHYP